MKELEIGRDLRSENVTVLSFRKLVRTVFWSGEAATQPSISNDHSVPVVGIFVTMELNITIVRKKKLGSLMGLPRRCDSLQISQRRFNVYLLMGGGGVYSTVIIFI